MSKMTRAEALNWVARTFEEPPGSLTPETSRDQIAAWDSLGILTLMANFDQDFGLMLYPGEAQNFRTVGDVLELLAQKGQLAD